MSNIQDLLDRYWQLADAEGRENRQHDTESGDAQECRSAIDAAILDLKDNLAESEKDTHFWVCEYDKLKRALETIARGTSITFNKNPQRMSEYEAREIASSALNPVKDR